MYAILDDHIHIEMPIDYNIFASKKFFVSLKEEMQAGVLNDRASQMRFFFRTYLKGKNYYQYFPSNEEHKEIVAMKMYANLIVKEAMLDVGYDPTAVSMKEDDVNIYLYHFDKLLYRLEKA